jgi:hypothetical protein
MTNVCPCGAPLIAPVHIGADVVIGGSVTCLNRHRWSVVASAIAADGSHRWQLGNRLDEYSRPKFTRDPRD